MQKRNPYYWWCQAGGWGLATVVMLLLYALSNQPINSRLLATMGIMIFFGIGTTHLFREYIRAARWLQLPVEKALPKFILGVIVVCLVDSVLRIWAIDFFELASSKRMFGLPTRFWLANVETVIFVIPWTLIYYFFHYIEKSRNQQVDTLKLETLVKELELKTIKSHINPHFIFNALNSIRALIDENPVRARAAVTELSNILRSSMQTEKQETVFFEKELSIVKDYLALEHIRFEDRLQVEYEIAPDTLSQPIPPMMLQTLVENAIKHGISKQVDGGTVTIISGLKGRHHELVIRNTGRLGSEPGTEEGFGLFSTRNRLQLLFGGDANFKIREVNGNTVEAVLSIPLT